MSRELIESKPAVRETSSRESMLSTIVLLLMMVVVIGVGLYLGWLWLLDHAPAFWSANSGWLVPTVIIVVIGGSAPWTAPLCWRVFRGIASFIQDMKDRNETRQLVISAWMAAEDGRFVKMVNGRTGDVIEIGAAASSPQTNSTVVSEIDQKGRPAIAAPRELVIPKPYDLYDIFKRHELTPDHLFLGKCSDDVLDVDSGTQLCHGVFNAITGKGKTIIERGIQAQLLFFEHEVIHLDPKFTLLDEKGLDYRPIAKKLLAQSPLSIDGAAYPHLIMDVKDIFAVMAHLALKEVPHRLSLYHQGIHTYKTLYVFLEEFLYLVKKHPEITEYVETVITIGRALGIKLFTVAQNFLARDTGLSGAMRENFETAFYLGGDDHSGAIILDMGKKELIEFQRQHNLVLGQGLTMIRNNSVAPQARLARTGMASNEAIYYLLGKADNFKLPIAEQMASLSYGTNRVVDAGERRTGPLSQNYRSLRLPGNGTHEANSARMQGHQDGQNGTGESENLPDGYAEKNGMRSPLDGTQAANNGRTEDYPLLSDLQVELFVTAYEITGNIDKSLERAGANTRYREHARAIIQQRNLRKK